jgi:hypothetical protein
VLRSNAKLLTDGDLLAKLRSFGIELDRSSLEQLFSQALSAEEIARPLLLLAGNRCQEQGRAKRPMHLREWQEVQEVLPRVIAFGPVVGSEDKR